MSPRNFARVFTKEMKTTPAKFVERLRVEAARRRLEESHNSMEMIADECGFGNVNSMRNVFQRTLKIAPGQYRRHFRHVKPRAKISSNSRREKIILLIIPAFLLRGSVIGENRSVATALWCPSP